VRTAKQHVGNAAHGGSDYNQGRPIVFCAADNLSGLRDGFGAADGAAAKFHNEGFHSKRFQNLGVTGFGTLK
jgi:hypothetical protein